MVYAVTCNFREPVKSYHLDPGDLELHTNSRIIGETDRGVELGQVKFRPREMDEASLVLPLRPVLRLATADDLECDAENRQLEADALRLFRERTARFELPMKPIKAEILHGRDKIYYYYEADSRIDFRELLRDLASQLQMRVQLTQVGSRDAARLLGGCGPCGQPLCCATFLTEMPPITLKLAREQNLPLTPSKISGACGRLMCCLRYEVGFYRDQNRRLPRPGEPVDTPEGPGHVVEVDALRERVVVRLGDYRHVTVTGDDLRALREERGPVRACKNHIKHGGTCGGSSGGGCGGGGCGKDGGCGCTLMKKTPARDLALV